MNVGAGIGVTTQLFRGHVAKGTDNFSGLRQSVRFDGACQSEIRNADGPVGIEQQIGRLDIAVQNTLTMSIIECVGGSGHQPCDVAKVNRRQSNSG
jgi:hypothetical protein